MSLKGDMVALTDKYFEKHEERVKAFRQKDIDFGRIDRAGVTDKQRDAIYMAMLVESFIPVYVEMLLHVRRFRDPSDEFSIIWGREELLHFRVLRSALRALGIPGEKLQFDIDRLRSTRNWEQIAKIESPFGPLKNEIYPLTNTMIQEKSTEIFYRSLAKQVKDPIVKEILKKLATDEARHHQYMYKALKLHLEHDPGGWPAAMRAIMEYNMPGNYQMENYQEIGSEAAKTAGVDGKAAFKEIKDKLFEILGWKVVPAGALLLLKKQFSKPPKIIRSTEINFKR